MGRMNRGVLPVVALWLLACAGDRRTGAPAGPDPAALIPPISSLPGWTLAESATEYGPETLFMYLDGAAPRYVGFGLVRLAHARFTRGGETQGGVILDVYDMGTKLGAFGLYSSGRPPDIVTRRWGAEGYRYREAAAAWKDRIYVHALADEDSPELTSMIEQLVERVAAAAPGDASAPEILRRLPVEDLVANTTRYVAQDLLGHAFLPGGLLARYECESEECLLFLCDLGSAGAARQAMEKLREHERRNGGVFEGMPEAGADLFRVHDPGLGPGVVTRADRFVGGVWGGGSRDKREALLGALAAKGMGPAVPVN